MKLIKALALLIVLTLMAAACTTTEEAAVNGDDCKVGETDGDLSFYNWTEYIDPDLLTQFEDEYGIKVQYSEYESNEAMLAKVDAGGAVYDLVVPSDYMVHSMRVENLLVPLNYDAIPNMANVDAFFKNPPFDPDNTYSVPYQWGTTGMAMSWDTLDAIGGEATWAAVFDPGMSAPYAGRISMLDDAPEAITAALKYLGYSINDVVTSNNEAAVSEAADLLIATKERLQKFDSVNFGDDLVNGEVDIAHGWSGGFFFSFDEADAWEDYGYFIPKEGGVVWTDNLAIPVTAEHPCSAHAMINFILDAQNGAQLTNWTFYGSPNKAAEAYINPDILEDPGVYPPAEVMAKLEFIPQGGDISLFIQDEFARAKSS